MVQRPEAPRAADPSASAPLPEVPGARRSFEQVDGINLHVVEAGDPSDPLAILLHGFPEFWYGWRHHVAPLVDAGYRVLVPDQRGYNRSGKPEDVPAYRLERLTEDVRALAEAQGDGPVHVAGHDWGGVVAWDLALRHPEAVDRLAVLNGPHPGAFRRTILTNPDQLRRSWYILLFQLPYLPEHLVTSKGFDPWEKALRAPAEDGTFTDADLDRYRAAWNREGAPTAMINWYRALVPHSRLPDRETVEAPTLVVWGEDDPALVPDLARQGVDRCEDGRLEVFPDASHWVNHERPDEVAELLVEHFRD